MSAAFDKMNVAEPGLGTELANLTTELRAAGVDSAAERLEIAAERADEVSPDVLFRLIDTTRLALDLEEVKGKATRWLSGWRNVLALAPLVVTWIALGYAASEYQNYLQQFKPDSTAYNDAIRTPFLVLWQHGFYTGSPFTFSFTAGVDFFLLLGIVALTFLAQRADARALAQSRRIVNAVDSAASRMVAAVSKPGATIPQNAKPEDWARVVQATIREALSKTEKLITDTQAMTREVADKAQAVMESVGKASTDLITQEMKPVVADFRVSVGDLKSEISNYQAGIATVSATITSLGQAAGVLATASTDLAQNSGAYNATATAISQHVQGLQASQAQLAGQMQQAADGMTATASSTQQLAGQQVGMVQNLDSATRALQQAELALNQTARVLDRAALRLQAASQAYTSTRGGLLGWFFRGSGGAAQP